MKKIGTCLGILILGMIVVVLLIQLVPYGRNHANPPVIKEPVWDSPQTQALAERACFDCHSNKTVWPWYSNIAPASWLVQRDVDEGRSRMNLSECGVPRQGGEGGEGGEGNEAFSEAGEEVLSGGMPPAQYLPLHPNARLTMAEREALVRGLASSPCQ